MMMNTSASLQTVLISLFLFSGLSALAGPDRISEESLIFAAPPPPDNLGAPGQRSDGAGSRGCPIAVETSTSSEGKRLTALVPIYDSPMPNTVFSKTSAERPTFWFYTPYTVSYSARLILLDSVGDPIYETNVELPEAPGVVSISLPNAAPPLETGVSYQWFLNVYCQDQMPPPIAFVEGWLQRDPLSTAEATQLEQLSLSEQVDFYAANGLWQDALTAAATLHSNYSNDANWFDLLQEVGLEELTSESVTGCCR